MNRGTEQIESSFEFCCKKFLAGSGEVSAQSEVGIPTKKLNPFVPFMLDYIDFSITNEIENQTVDLTLDYCTSN